MKESEREGQEEEEVGDIHKCVCENCQMPQWPLPYHLCKTRARKKI